MKQARFKPVKANKQKSLTLSWRDARYHKFYKIIDQLVHELQERIWVKTGKLKRRLKGSELEKLHYSVECLVRNSIAVVLERKRKGEASVHLGQYYYGSNRPDKLLTYKIYIQRAFRGLEELSYVQVTKDGFFDRKGRKDGTSTSRLSRYIALDKLLNLFTDSELRALPAIIPQYSEPELIKVRVKEKDQNGVDRKVSILLPENGEHLFLRYNLKIINKALSKHWYDLEIPDDELTELQKRLADDPENERTIRMDHRSLHRVFNDRELQTGGRFYGGWWQNIPKEFRQYLTVNGKRMVELDYSNQHPSILYAWEGVKRPADCYSEVIDLSHLPHRVMQTELRDMVKAAFNAMLNSPRVLKNAPTGVNPKRFGLKWREISDAIIAFHKPIAHYFYSGVGLKLQRLDSDIAEKILLYFAKDGIAILPLHDSFLMHHGHETSLEPMMREAFEDIVGVAPKVDRKIAGKEDLAPVGAEEWASASDSDDEFGPEENDDLVELLAREYGHDYRLSAFYALKSQQNVSKITSERKT